MSVLPANMYIYHMHLSACSSERNPIPWNWTSEWLYGAWALKPASTLEEQVLLLSYLFNL